MNSLILFSSAFCVVFFLGMQSLCVNTGRRAFAFVNSLLIGLSHLALYKLTPNAEGYEIVAYLAGGPFGIVTAMTTFEYLNTKAFFTKARKDA